MNVYEDAKRAEAYASLEFPGTYFLAYRDLPAIIAEHVSGGSALDFGCGAGRSTRFLESLGFETIGVDISMDMVRIAREIDTEATYLHIEDGDFSGIADRRFDLVLCAFPFDNIPGESWRATLLGRLGRLLRPNGRIVLLGSTPDIYRHEWVSFTTAAFPENRLAKSGDPVRVVMKDVDDSRPVVDYIWFHDDYVRLFAATGLDLAARYLPLGRDDESSEWISETSIAPWVIYVLQPKSSS